VAPAIHYNTTPKKRGISISIGVINQAFRALSNLYSQNQNKLRKQEKQTNNMFWNLIN
jgi:hypothetical protein